MHTAVSNSYAPAHYQGKDDIVLLYCIVLYGI